MIRVLMFFLIGTVGRICNIFVHGGKEQAEKAGSGIMHLSAFLFLWYVLCLIIGFGTGTPSPPLAAMFILWFPLTIILLRIIFKYKQRRNS